MVSWPALSAPRRLDRAAGGLRGGGGVAAAPRAAEHVIIVMLDGTRPDALRRARVPVLRGLEEVLAR
jgi:hypothetical protein